MKLSTMGSKSQWLYLTILSLVLATIGLVHQKLFTPGGWFDWEQFSHHESLIAIALIVCITSLLAHLLERRQGKRWKEQNSRKE